MGNAKFCKECGSPLVYQLIEGRSRALCRGCGGIQYEQLIVGAGGVIEQGDRLLLLRRTTDPFKGYWNLPAGHVEADEDPKQAAVREISEETGLKVEIAGLFDVFFFDDHPKGCGVFVVYRCSVIGGTLKRAEAGGDPTFFSRDQLPIRLSGGGHRQAILSWRDRRGNIERGEMWNQLSNAVSLRSSEDQVLWSIFGAFWATNAILLVALFNTGNPPGHLVGWIVSFVGFVISLAWHKIQSRALGYVKRHEALMKRIEHGLGLEPRYAVSPDINEPDYEEYLGKGLRARQVMAILSTIASSLWLAAGSLFLFLWFSSE